MRCFWRSAGTFAGHSAEWTHKPLTYIQQTVNILTIEHVYRYATLLMVFVCVSGACV